MYGRSFEDDDAFGIDTDAMFETDDMSDYGLLDDGDIGLLGAGDSDADE